MEPSPPDGDPTTVEAAPSGTYRLGRDARYLTWLTSDTATGLVAALATFAIPLIALAATRSPTLAGIIGAVSMVARLIATLIGGVLADRHDRIALMVVGGVIGLVLAATFTALAVTDALTFTTLLIISLLLSVRGGLFEVAGESAIKQIVPSAAMGRAQAANQARDAAIGLAGSPLGGVLLGVGAWLVGAAMVLTQSIALAAAALLRRGERTPVVEAHTLRTQHDAHDAAAPPERTTSAWQEAKEGVVWLFRRPDLRGVLLVATIVNLGFNAGVTTIIYALQVEGYSPAAIGGASAIVSAAMLAAAALGPFLVSRVGAGALTIASLALSTAGMLAVGQVTSFAAICAVLSVSVLGIPALNAALLGYMTVATPSRLLGRVNSAARVMSMGALPLAPLIAGFGLDWIGRTGTIAIAGLICAAAAVLAAASPSLRALPRESQWQEYAARFGTE